VSATVISFNPSRMPNLFTYSLTLGLMGLDELHLRVLATSSDDEKEKRNAHTGTFHCLGKDRVDN